LYLSTRFSGVNKRHRKKEKKADSKVAIQEEGLRKEGKETLKILVQTNARTIK